MSAGIRRIELPLAPALLALLLFAYILPGLVGHDPWKPDDAIGIGIVHQMLEHGEWLLPHLAGEPYLQDGPFYYWLAALAAKLSGFLLAPHDGARLASGVLMAITLACVHLAGRELYGKREGVSAALTLLGCLGLLVHAHEAVAEMGMLAGQALAWYGIALAPRKPQRASAILGAGLLAAALSKGPLAVLAPVVVALFAPLASEAWRRREYLVTVFAAFLALAALFGAWTMLLDARYPGLARVWWRINSAPLALPSLEALAYWGETLAWAAWPAWPLATWTLWEGRRRSLQSGTRMLLAALAVSLAILLLMRSPREVFALPLLLPLSVLAGAGIPSLRRGATNALSWFGVMSAGFLGAIVWFGWFAMVTGVPSAMARNFTRLEPGFVPEFSWPALAVALAYTLAWLGLILKCERSVFRGVTFWAAGMTLLWGLAMTLVLSWIDYGKSYRQVAQSLKKHIPPGTHCVESRSLGEAQRAVLDYHAEVLTQRRERVDARCPLLLIQAREGEPDRVESGWKLVWEGHRPRDRERYRLYRREKTS